MFLWKPICHKTTQECFMEVTCFLSTELLKLSGAVNGHYGTQSSLFCNKVATFMQSSAPMEAHMA